MSIGPWRILLRERAPLPLMLAVGAAQVCSAAAVVGASLRVATLALGATAIAALLVLLRLMDDVKDVSKDRLAHPKRPLPRGLVSVRDAKHAVTGMTLVLVGAAVVLALSNGTVPALWYVASLGWSWLMYREFHAARLLSRNAFVYAITHQAVLLPMYAFAVALVAPDRVIAPAARWFALGGVGAGFAYEVARKLDPVAPAILGTYATRHGKAAALTALMASLALASWAAHSLGVALVVWPAVAVALVAVALFIASPARHALVARGVGAVVVIQLLAPALRLVSEVIAP